MAAQPRAQKMKALWLKLGQAEFGPTIDEAGTVRPTDAYDWPLSRVAGGMTITALAAMLAGPDYLNEPVSRPWVSNLLRWGAKDRVKSAKIEAAGVLAEEAVAIADKPISSVAEAQQARLQVDVRKWMAGILDRDTYSEKATVAVNVNLGTLHLEALRRRALTYAHTPPQLASGSEQDYEVVQEAEA